jgi:two-component system nitrogen regulation sensor histidine kinase NtrY
MLKRSDRIIAFIAAVSLMTFIGFHFFSSSRNSDEQIAHAISLNLQDQLTKAEAESRQLIKLNEWSSLYHSFFLVDSSQLIKWNRNDFLPDLRLLRDTFSIRWIHTSRGDFVLKRIKIERRKELLTVIPLIEHYKIANDFLDTKWNTDLFPVSGVQVLDPALTEGFPIKDNDGETLFRVIIPGQTILSESGIIVHVLWWIGIAASLIFLFRITYSLLKSGRGEIGFISLGIGLLVIRLICAYLNVPNLYSLFLLFDPRVFASSSITSSIGDLLLNTLAVVILCVYVFFTYNQWKSLTSLIQLRGIKKKIALMILACASFFIILFPFLYFETIFHNSSISLDISQSLRFDLVRVVAFICVGLSGISAFCFSHVFFRLFLNLSDYKWWRVVSYLLAGAIVFIIYFLILERNYWITLNCALVYFLSIYFLRFTNTLKVISYRTFFYLLATILLFSVQAALSVRRFTEEKHINAQFRFANEFLVGRDYFAEFLLNEVTSKIKEDPFIQSSLSNPFLSKSSIKQKVRQIYLNNYFDRYDINIHLYNSVGESLDREPFLDFASQVQTYQNQSNGLGYKGIYFTTSSTDQSDRKYLVVAPVERSGVPVGFVVLELSMKKFVPRNVYPELLVDNRFSDYRNRDYSFAIYSKSELISSYGEFNYDRDFDENDLKDQTLYVTGKIADKFVHVGVEDDNDRIAVVSTHTYSFFSVLGNFSFWVVFGFFLVLCGLVLQGIYYWTQGEQINYSSRVQFYFYSSLLLPLLVVSITTLGIITRSAASQLNQEFIDKSKLLSESLTPDLVELATEKTFIKEEFERKLRDVARVSDVDATVYDSTGFLIASSQPLIFDYQFKSELIDREALDKVTRGKEISFVKQDQIGSLKYYSAFSAIRSPESGNLLGIVSLPFFGSASSLEKTQINILISILTVFTAVLLIFSVLSLLAANQLTYPLRIISSSLSRTTLTGHNEPLAWNSNDEIGIMVKEYNRMVQNLEQSKIELARSQKETAWREMAKQVAHEIKNPLTPMKLSLQQMEYLLKSNEGLPKEKAEQSIKTILAQVDILNEIASSFSTFARMPAPVMVKVELNTILKRTVDLYANNSYGMVDWTPFNKPVFTMGDDQLLTRIFSNIILNGLQAGEDGKTFVKVKLTEMNGKALVVIQDNGSGISKELVDKIFVPYFSTKKSGSGLGLAIVKQGIEQSGGEVSLESQEGKGTSFYIQFPLV